MTLHHGDCLEVMNALPEASVTGIVTDPPYGLSFMGKNWDHGIPGPAFWEAALRISKPGTVLLAFGGTRTYHRLACAIEDGGWELRDCLMWIYGSGFPKSMDLSKAIDKDLGAERPVLSSRVQRVNAGSSWGDLIDAGRHAIGEHAYDVTGAGSPEAKRWDGYGTALKPAWEPIVLAMKPPERTYLSNLREHGVAGLNLNGCRIGASGGTQSLPLQNGESKRANVYGTYGACGPIEDLDMGRWPANLIFDSEAADHLNGQARFFYVPKASQHERSHGHQVRNSHPTVKPVDLMRWLVRLVTMPKDTVVLDPFMGSGSTGVACVMEKVKFVGIEREAAYIEIARKRIELQHRVGMPKPSETLGDELEERRRMRAEAAAQAKSLIGKPKGSA